ncbi:hypothetical protein CC1G_06013 [Coprinopsis cinerea okayama7|uniref:F-box domain-containing protein n=1 Tax=Coprinopsis cinerea (strain Okayama-7 / 130 / ATCC MYA-4618 / FGSC 9003) TaxID=240176 RepID=A8N4N5_COPC7|nr:hypothetical protein CC1G_06013 [Coprinopsis cinerea okayama7\|eukprot:XP_001829804.1 hypothetical protein CC1G_06013 [Coprinopsis cinerea okayama7\
MKHIVEQKSSGEKMLLGLSSLPYDLLLNIAIHLNSADIHSLNMTCKSLHGFSKTRPVYRKLAADLLRRCRALPLKGFQQLTDLTTEQLVKSVDKATRYEMAWKKRGPRPIGTNTYSNYMDVSEGDASSISHKWYKVVSSPPGEDVDWLSPITSSYTLCATKKGRVVCWDVQTDRCLAEWNPGEKWELWKCRVEFEERTVYFTMAKVLSGGLADDDRVMEFILMRLTFSDGPSGETSKDPPVFSHVTEFRTSGVVMNVFLLDPSSRLLSAFIWVSSSNTIGLYALLDWDNDEYVFIDTGIECVTSSNWSCILYDGHIVIHSEESDIAYQYFYPLSLLRKHTSYVDKSSSAPKLSRRVTPWRTISKRFIFPALTHHHAEPPEDVPIATTTTLNGITVNGTGSSSIVPVGNSEGASPPNPFPFLPWYPESAHFVRQWWPTLPGIPRVSCTVVLLATHDQVTHRTRFVLAQHYFRVPINHAQWFQMEEEAAAAAAASMSSASSASSSTSSTSTRTSFADDPMKQALIAQDEALMHMWYVSAPFEVVRVFEFDEDDEFGERPRPLVAVDFGHAAWIEYVDPPQDPLEGDEAADSARDGEDGEQQARSNREGEDSDEDMDSDGGDGEPKRLRFVTFPSFRDELEYVGLEREQWLPKPEELEGEVRTLEVPDELDLGTVETINIDQSQGAVILSDRMGKIYILCYE